MQKNAQQCRDVIQINDQSGSFERAQTLMVLQRLRRKARRINAHIKQVAKRSRINTVQIPVRPGKRIP